MYLPTDGLIIIARVVRPFLHISFPKPLTRANIFKFYLVCLLCRCKNEEKEVRE